MRFTSLLIVAPLAAWADARCIACHAGIVESYAKTGMGRSMSRPRAESQVQRSWWHDVSGRRMGIDWRDGKMLHFVEDRGNRAAHEIAWAVGSGNEGKSYLVQIGHSLFQSPISWYSARLFWDMSPGYHIDARPDFNRPVTAECLTCHAGQISPIAGTQNRYGNPAIVEEAIGCGRCHGDVAAHLAKAERGNIVNPAKLSRERRDSVCESCHLSGEARIPNPGRVFSDFRPGMQLEEVFSVYVPLKKSSDTVLKVISHSEQMASSKCAEMSAGKLWCASCHDPHKQPNEREKAAYYRDRCVSCHAKESIGAHVAKVGDDCVKCHMPRTRSYDGGHAAFTDHWIRTKKSENRFLDRGELLRAWREPAAAVQKRNLALAYVGNAAKSRSLARYREGVRLLNESMQEGHRDAAFAGVVGLQYLRDKQPARAAAWFQVAVQQETASSLARLNFAAALAGIGKTDDAKREAEEAIRLEPLLEEAYALLAEIEPKRAGFWKDQYRKLAPKRILP
ncbi:MAG: hypothetical protein FJW32_00510 [Acidobacteria bacterium]|nr:hypothetical protein [Acidobacteriota bacterium]